MPDETITVTEDGAHAQSILTSGVVTVTEDSPHEQTVHTLQEFVFKPATGPGLRYPNNQLEDPGFEEPDRELLAWNDGTNNNVRPNGWDYSDENPRSGNYHFQAVVAAAGSPVYDAALMRVEVGETVYFGTHYQATETGSDMGEFRMDLEFLDEALTVVGSPLGQQLGPQSIYTRAPYKIAVPNGAVYAHYKLSFIGFTSVTGKWRFDDCFLGRTIPGELIAEDSDLSVRNFGAQYIETPTIIVTDTLEAQGDAVMPTIGPDASQQHALPAEASDTLATQAHVAAAVAGVSYTDEQAQDAIGAMVDSSLVYNDATPLLTRAALTGDVTAPQGSNATTIANDAVTYAKIQNVSATDKILGRSTAGAGDVEEIACTAAGRAILDDADATAQRATLGLGALATKATVATADIDTDAVTYAKIQNVSATDKILGRSTAGAGDVEEIACTAAGRALIDDANAAAQRVTLGVEIGVNVQAYDATLAALAAYNTNGLLVQTAADTFTGRTITGTANKIAVTNGDGVSGNPTLNIGSDVVTLTDAQTLTNKTLTSPAISSPALSGIPALTATRPTHEVIYSGEAIKVRLASLAAKALHLTLNANFDGTNWSQDSTARDSILFNLNCITAGSEAFNIISIAAGGVTPVTRFSVMAGSGNVKIGGSANRATTEGTNQVVIFNGTAPVGTLANGVSLYSTAGELRVMDSGGNATLLSSHDHATNEWIFYSVNTVTGKALKIDMERMMRFLNKHFGTDFVHEYLDEQEARPDLKKPRKDSGDD